MSRAAEHAPTDASSDRASPERLTEDRLLALAADRVARGWCRISLAEDRAGRRVEPWSPGACRWSPLGAMLAVWLERGDPRPEVLEVAYAALAIATGGRPEEWSAAPWRTAWHVLSALSRARQLVPQARGDVPPITAPAEAED
jgi:hypothetical protein